MNSPSSNGASGAWLTTVAELQLWCQLKRRKGGTIVATNGCFDLLHPGHLHLLNFASSEGTHLIVGVNSDESVQRLKGAMRPIFSETDRMRMLLALRCVSAAFIFEDIRAAKFLEAVQPHVWVKGGDYTLDSLDPTERLVLERGGGRIVLVPSLPQTSTSLTLKRILSNA